MALLCSLNGRSNLSEILLTIYGLFLPQTSIIAEVILSFSYSDALQLPDQTRWEVNSVDDEQQQGESSHV